MEFANFSGLKVRGFCLIWISSRSYSLRKILPEQFFSADILGTKLTLLSMDGEMRRTFTSSYKRNLSGLTLNREATSLCPDSHTTEPMMDPGSIITEKFFFHFLLVLLEP